MKGALFGILLIALCPACRVAPQPDSIRIAAAYEVPLPTRAERHQFLNVLRREAATAGFHLDAATEEELRILSNVSPLTMKAAIWRGDNDEEIVAIAMSTPRTPDRIWIWFHKGENPAQSVTFRRRLMRAIIQRWPETLPLPVTPAGGIPSPENMERTPSGYVVKPSERWRYEEPKELPAAPR